MKIILFITSMFFQFQLSHGQCFENLLINGSFTGTPGEDKHVDEWISTSSPDINGESGELQTTPGYHWMGKPIQSPDGGTWQNLYSQRESLEQTVALTIGRTYTITFFYTSQPISYSVQPTDEPILTLNSPVGIYLYINDELVYRAPNDDTPFSWEKGCYEFKTTTDSVKIRFCASVDEYAGLDGVSLTLGHQCSWIP